MQPAVLGRAKWLVAIVVLSIAVVWPIGATVPTAKPEDVGLSSERLRRVDELIQRHIEARTLSGAVTLVARYGRIAHFEARGLQDLESKKPIAKDTIFRIMSMTKPVVGVAILMLVEEGKVRLNDPASKFIPELKDLKVAVASSAPPAAPGSPAPSGVPFETVAAERQITIRDLLTQTSGLMSGPISNRESVKLGLEPQETLADFLPRLKNVPLEFQPGSRWAYSATGGFDVLARIVEVASQRTVAQFFRERIFEPLGMKDTFFYPLDGNPRLVTLYGAGANGLEKRPVPRFMNGTYFSGGGGLMSTAEDYLQFATMLLNRGEANGRRLLAPRTVDLMASAFAPDTLPGRTRGTAFGLSVRVVTDPAAAGTYLSEGSFGWSGAYGTHFWVDPKEKLIGILMAQTALTGRGNDFETAVMQAVVGESLSREKGQGTREK